MAKNLHHKYRGIFFIFPAMIPLIEILPWLLTIIGTLAGGVRFLEPYIAFHHRYRPVIYTIMTLCFVVAGGLYLWEKMHVPADDVGSVLVAEADLPTLITEKKIPYFSNTSRTPTWPAGSLPRLWSISSKAEFLGNPVIAGDLMLIGTFANTLEARSLVDGSLVWNLQKHQPVFTIPKVEGQKIYIGEGLHTANASGLTALSYPDGKVLWERKFASHLESYPEVDDDHDRLWIGAGSFGVWALDSETGKKLWWAKIGHMDTAPLYTDEHLYAHTKLTEDKNGSAFFEIDPDDGDVIWSEILNGNPMGKIMGLGDGKFLLSTAIGQVGLNKDTDAGWVYGIDTTHSKKIRWMTKLSTMALPEGQISRDKKTAYFAVKNGEIWAINTAIGAILWIKKCGVEFKTDVTLFEEGGVSLVIGLTTDGTVHVVRATDGVEIQKFNVGAGSYSAPLYKDGRLYITTHHSIFAFDVGGGA